MFKDKAGGGYYLEVIYMFGVYGHFFLFLLSKGHIWVNSPSQRVFFIFPLCKGYFGGKYSLNKGPLLHYFQRNLMILVNETISLLLMIFQVKYFLLYQGAVECTKLLEPKISNINISDRYLARTKF